MAIACKGKGEICRSGGGMMAAASKRLAAMVTIRETACPPEQLHVVRDARSGLNGVIVIHSTALGPAAGGCRLWSYADHASMVADACRLAEGMTYKNALAGNTGSPR